MTATTNKKLTAAEIQKIEMLSSLRVYTETIFREVENGNKFLTMPHHERIIKTLEDVVDGKLPRVIINMPPRYGKTEICIKSFISWGFALNPACKFLHVSYSDTLAYSNSAGVRKYMEAPTYQRLFPDSRLKDTKQSVKNWDTFLGGQMYARPSQGQITGFGAGSMNDIVEEEVQPSTVEDFVTDMDRTYQKQKKYVFSGAVLIDDPIKPEDALSEIVRDRVNSRFDVTIRNRVNSRHTPIILIMQRLHEDDLSGFLMSAEAEGWHVLSIPAIEIDENGNRYSIWEDKHTLNDLDAMAANNPLNFETQYMQNPTPAAGLMYSPFKEYELIPPTKKRIAKNATDVADTGKDYLASACYEQTEIGCFITDILYTKKAMEYTEPALAAMLSKEGTKVAKIESNAGGRGFARNVANLLRMSGNNYTKITTFTQSGNKKVRIFANSTKVTNVIFMPKGWQHKWPEFYKHVTGYRKETNNLYDDAADMLTQIVEGFEKDTVMKGIKRRN